MNIRQKLLEVPENVHVVSVVVYSIGGEYFMKECESQMDAVKDGWIYWNHLTQKEQEKCEVFFAGICQCDEEGVADLRFGAWVIADWLDDPDEVTYRRIRKIQNAFRVSAC